MKERYAQEPMEGYTINRIENDAVITFRENIILAGSDEEENPAWEADKYVLVVPFRESLNNDIEINQTVWLQAAKDWETEILSADARAKRDALLTESDKCVLPDYPITDEQRLLVTAYRQALRDVPEQDGFPGHITWPVLEI